MILIKKKLYCYKYFEMNIYWIRSHLGLFDYPYINYVSNIKLM